jgi:glycosyltransferase involved in cell wall biosynthesis
MLLVPLDTALMRIAIYDRWLHTLGGGERELGALAEALQDDHEVHIITHQPADLGLLAERLNLHVAANALRVVPFDPGYDAVASASANYDLLINMSHGDLFVPRARHSLLRVFFPQPADLGPMADGTPIHLIDGWYRPEDGFVWTGRVAQISLRRTPRARWTPGSPYLHVELHGWRPAGAPPAIVKLSGNGIPLGERTLPPGGTWTTWRIALRGSLAPASVLELRFEATTFNPSALGMGDDNRELGVAIAHMGVNEGMFQGSKVGTRLDDQALYSSMLRQQVLPAARKYDMLLANSQFTQRWIDRRWNLVSEVLYPPIDVAALVPTAKQPLILSVGRFFAGSHNKKHLPMIAAFRTLYDEGLRGWEYHLVGGCDESMPEHLAYLNEVRAAAAGYPIVVHVNIAYGQLRALYGTASIFWHATGYEEDEERDPERFEHFGISTVEAMAAGGVPIVIGKAGQVEIVEHARNGLLWQTLPELAQQTLIVIKQPSLRDALAAEAQASAQRFAPEPFAAATRRIVAGFSELTTDN